MNVTYGLRRALQLNPRGRATSFRGRHRSWAETGGRVGRLAAGLRALGVEPGGRVAILALNSDRYLEAYLAIAWAGAVAVPLNIRWSGHANVTANALNSLSEGVWTQAMRYLHAAPMFHLANGMGMYAALLQGGSNVMVQGFAPEGVMAAIAAEQVTDTLLVPTMIQMMVDHPSRAQYDLSSMRRVVYGASPMSGAVLARAIEAMPGTAFIQAYGMTELSPCATLLHWHEHSGEGRARGRDRGAGRAVIGCEVQVVDLDRNPVPPGTVGEIAVRGDTVMLGYWNRPEDTARAVVDGWMHTGDGGVLDADGFLTVVDRIKDMIITGGENVYSVEVENAIAQHPDVAQCAVIGIPSERWGEQVHAVVVPRPDAEPTPEEVIAFCRTMLGGFKCPRSVEIRDTPLPLSGAGKVLKRDLRAPFWSGYERRVS